MAMCHSFLSVLAYQNTRNSRIKLTSSDRNMFTTCLCNCINVNIYTKFKKKHYVELQFLLAGKWKMRRTRSINLRRKVRKHCVKTRLGLKQVLKFKL